MKLTEKMDIMSNSPFGIVHHQYSSLMDTSGGEFSETKTETVIWFITTSFTAAVLARFEVRNVEYIQFSQAYRSKSANITRAGLTTVKATKIDTVTHSVALGIGTFAIVK